MSLKRYLKRLTGAVSGELGERNNPVCCHDPSGEKHYLNRLRGNMGKRPTFVRQGCVGKGPYGNMLDLYVISSSGTPDREIYFDMYHRGHVELMPIPGYLIFNLGAGKFDLTPPADSSDIKKLSQFGQKLRDAARDDGASLRQFLKFALSAEDCSKIIVFAVSLILFSYGDDREKVVDAVVRNKDLNVSLDIADNVVTFIVGE